MWDRYQLVGLSLVTLAVAGCWRVGPNDSATAPDADADGETAPDGDTDADTDTDADSETESESDVESDTDTQTEYVDLTPATGATVEGGDPGSFHPRGYHLMAATDVHVLAVEWWVRVQTGASVQAQICDDGGTLLESGSISLGDSTEKWHRSEVDVTFEAGENYFVAFSIASDDALYLDHKYGPDQPFEIPGYFWDVWAVSGYPDIEECEFIPNVWAPYMRLECGD